MDMIKWGDIIAECGNYRDGFVTIFRRYEGQPTDERDARGVVKVTAKSFAEHMGIDPRTFTRWVAKHGLDSASKPPRSKGDFTRDVTRAARADTDAVVAGIMNAPEETQNAIYVALADRLVEKLPFGGDKPHIPGEDRTPDLVDDIERLSVKALDTAAVLEVKLAAATVEQIDRTAATLANVAQRYAELFAPYVPSADTVEDWLRDRSGT
jgi:hypothetical protein